MEYGFPIFLLFSGAVLGLVWLLELRHRSTTWHRWWAWHPVKVGGRTVWFETVERDYCSPAGYGGGWWEYREAA